MGTQINYSDQTPEMLPSEKQQYTETVVKKLIYQMFERHMNGLKIVDFGNVQYKYLEIWGAIDLDDWKDNITAATLMDRAEVNCMTRMVKPLQKKENIENLAKWISVRNCYDRTWRQGTHISTIL